ncbi:hypothetical protein HDE68_002659 [Pedobacter cryoconitis]|uniref:Uncharacterized protein n=1 Tax=Pedobacter cryoconitis TaxID=188932 RepID=A0A7W9DZ71_9SPHI|nr:hypothetical protein [Pedobacter cryoconitis]MBB5636758.1 hypothetical protein [Pedobacter cryoconitis]
MNNSPDNKVAYYAESEIKVIDEYHLHFCKIGEEIGENTQEQFYIYDTSQLKIIKRK